MHTHVKPNRAPSSGALQRQVPLTISSLGTTEVQFELPGPGQLRVRRLVHRGAPRPVSKFHSLTLGRAVQCESALEVDVAKLLDACPAVTAFAEQPLALRYFDQGAFRRHVPDFMFDTGDHRGLLEDKFETDIDEDLRHRTKRLIQLLAPYGWQYRLLTETTVRAGHLLENVQRLLRRGRQRPPEHWSLATFNHIRRYGPVALGEFGWGHVGQAQTGWISHEILMGNVQVDLYHKLSAASLLHVESPDQGGALSWLLAQSK